MDYDSHTLLELKTMCKDRGLKVSGSKAEVVIRLMEDDESKQPESVTIPQQSINLGHQQMYGGQQPTQIFITNNSTNSVQLTGFGIIGYGFFRVAIAMLFSEWEAEQSFFALVIGLGYIFGGVLAVQGYRIGLQFTLATLVVSGGLSLIYHNEVGPLSIGMGGFWPVELSLVCSGFCMLIVAIPLLTAPPTYFKQGTPNYLNTFLHSLDTISPFPFLFLKEPKDNVDEKIVINCTHCNSPLKVPVSYKGNVKCPSCGEKFEVN